MLKLLLNCFVETMIKKKKKKSVFFGYKVQKNSIYIKYIF